MICGLGNQDIGQLGILGGIDKGLFRIKTIAGNDNFKFWMRRTYFFQYSFGSIDLTILLGMAIGIGHRLRGKGQNLAHMRMKHNRLKHLMRVSQRPFGPFASQTARAVDLLGRKILEPSRAIK